MSTPSLSSPNYVFGVTFKKITVNLFENFDTGKVPQLDRAHTYP